MWAQARRRISYIMAWARRGKRTWVWVSREGRLIMSRPADGLVCRPMAPLALRGAVRDLAALATLFGCRFVAVRTEPWYLPLCWHCLRTEGARGTNNGQNERKGKANETKRTQVARYMWLTNRYGCTRNNQSEDCMPLSVYPPLEAGSPRTAYFSTCIRE
jgi:hypothetical protein